MKKFDPKSIKPLKLKAGAKLLKSNHKEFLRNKENITKGLAEALCDGDIEASKTYANFGTNHLAN